MFSVRALGRRRLPQRLTADPRNRRRRRTYLKKSGWGTRKRCRGGVVIGRPTAVPRHRVTAPMAANKGHDDRCRASSRAPRGCRWSIPVPEPTQFVLVFDLGGSRVIGSLISTMLVQAAVAATAIAGACWRRFPVIRQLHLAVLSYYGPSVVSLSAAVLSTAADEDVVVVVAVASIAYNAARLGAAMASTSVLALHHRPLWHEARAPTARLVRLMVRSILPPLFSWRSLFSWPSYRGWEVFLAPPGVPSLAPRASRSCAQRPTS